MNKYQNVSVKNILKKYHVRVFSFNDNYLLVDSENFAFMMFKPRPGKQKDNSSSDIPTVEIVDFYFRFPLSDFKTVTRITFDNISQANFQYLCDTFSNSCILKPHFKDYNERIQLIMHVHGISPLFAHFVARNPNKINLYEICQDIREANFYIQHKENWIEILKKGQPKDKKAILKKLLPTKTYQILRIDVLEPKLINIISHEIIHIA